MKDEGGRMKAEVRKDESGYSSPNNSLSGWREELGMMGTYAE
jgi:hypothetical protein